MVAEAVSPFLYTLDASVLIDLRRNYPAEIFPSLWTRLNGVATEGRILLPEEVVRELEAADDESLPWVNSHQHIKCAINEEQIHEVRNVLKAFPKMIDPKKVMDADPWLVAFAIVQSRKEEVSFWPRKVVLLTHEKRNKVPFGDPIGRPKLPNVCDHFHVRCMTITEVFAAEGWTF